MIVRLFLMRVCLPVSALLLMSGCGSHRRIGLTGVEDQNLVEEVRIACRWVPKNGDQRSLSVVLKRSPKRDAFVSDNGQTVAGGLVDELYGSVTAREAPSFQLWFDDFALSEQEVTGIATSLKEEVFDSFPLATDEREVLERSFDARIKKCLGEAIVEWYYFESRRADDSFEYKVRFSFKHQPDIEVTSDSSWPLVMNWSLEDAKGKWDNAIGGSDLALSLGKLLVALGTEYYVESLDLSALRRAVHGPIKMDMANEARRYCQFYQVIKKDPVVGPYFREFQWLSYKFPLGGSHGQQHYYESLSFTSAGHEKLEIPMTVRTRTYQEVIANGIPDVRWARSAVDKFLERDFIPLLLARPGGKIRLGGRPPNHLSWSFTDYTDDIQMTGYYFLDEDQLWARTIEYCRCPEWLDVTDCNLASWPGSGMGADKPCHKVVFPDGFWGILEDTGKVRLLECPDDDPT